MKTFILSLSVLFFTLPNQATELRMSKSQALAQGFKATRVNANQPTKVDIAPNSLAWPVQFIDQRHTIGNSMPQYQNYSNEAYYHEGADLRVSQSGKVIAPVNGFLQGDYYTYVTDQNTGEDKKYTKPITEGGDPLYFEITITTAEGFLFEFHHINPKSLPKVIYELVLRGGGTVSHGEVLGTAAVWPSFRFGERYDHIHYNLISPNGIYMNPEFYSNALADKSAPVIKNIFAIYKDQKVEVLDQKLKNLPTELIISSIDMKGDNIYPLPPVLVEASWSENQKVGWNFTKTLLNNLGSFPDIREVFARNLRLSDGRSFTTKGDYSNTVFLYRLKLPGTVTSPITLTVKDSSANEKKILLNITTN